MYKTYIDRLRMSVKRNGAVETLARVPRKVRVLLRDLKDGKRSNTCYNLIVKHTANLPWHYSFLGGYTIKKCLKIPQNSEVALCFGIYDDINLERSLSELGYKVYAFDPTPVSQALFNNNPDYRNIIHYTPCAVWSEDKKMKFYYKGEDQEFDNFEGTLEDVDHSGAYELVDAFSLQSIIEKFDLGNVAYLKMDIEGAVPEVLISYFASIKDKEQLPYEIVFELEIPKDLESPKSREILKKIELMFDQLSEDYNVYNVPSDNSLHNLHIHCTRLDRETVSV